jgi:nitrogen-specific signal transduction histidine kinase/CheY-like chemotaxis protein
MTFEQEVPQDDGPHSYLAVMFPLRDSSGEPYGLCGIATDVTEQKRTEERLRQSQKMEAVGRLAGGVAHDFNNILTAILGYGALLRDQVPSAAARADLDEIEAEGERAAALTQQLLAFSRKEALSPKVLDLNAIVADTERMLTRVLGENVALSCRLSPELGWVKADKSQLEQVVLNLAVNARDAMPGGGSLTIETANRELDEEYCQSHPEARPGRHAMLAVTDTGTGMDAPTLARIFEPFFTTKEAGRGTGLGLSTVYGIARQSGGHIAVLSEPGRGTSFQLYLPIVTEAPEAETKASIHAPSGAGEVVLLVEDEEPLRRLGVRILSKAGYAVIEAGDAESALALFQERGSEIRLLLTDVVLPKNNGRWLAEKLREFKPALRVLYTSGYSEEVIAHQGRPNAAVHFLPKPFTAESLLSRVRSALDA